MANLSKTLHINFYQNRSGIVEVMIKNFGVFFMPHSVDAHRMFCLFTFQWLALFTGKQEGHLAQPSPTISKNSLLEKQLSWGEM